ncbi:MAG: site-2 protease family protein [Deltaproteobacteria bacterium]|nr:site-2 protease family protein [Deltaproteobacteria bacterium]
MDERAYPMRHKLERPKILLPSVLFVITIITTVTAGALYQGADILHSPWDIAKGIPFSISLILILGTHELGHFIASRRHGVSTTLPVFIPGPPLPPMIGTFGAVIKIKSPITTKSALVDIGASGPLSGFAVALIVTAIGLELSTVMLVTPSTEVLALGSSLIFKFLTYITVGTMPEGYDVMLHPVAFAGWIGMFVTAMNLLPIGQLDGGHIVYALIGRKHRLFSMAMIAILVVLGIFNWTGWFIWAALISVIGMWHPPIEDEYSPMDGKRKAVTAAAIIVFILTFMPTPFYIV